MNPFGSLFINFLVFHIICILGYLEYVVNLCYNDWDYLYMASDLSIIIYLIFLFKKVISATLYTFLFLIHKKVISQDAHFYMSSQTLYKSFFLIKSVIFIIIIILFS